MYRAFSGGCWLSLVTVALGTACAVPPVQPPRAEFIISTSDSAYWVRTDASGVRVRGVPLTLAWYDRAFHEVYVADVDRSFSDAILTGERLYVRNLLTGDSSMVYEDTAVIRFATRHAARFPSATPLGPDDPSPEDPALQVTGETDILEVHGPYALIEHRSSVDRDGEESDDTSRAAVDLRTGHGVPPSTVASDTSVHDSTLVLDDGRRWRRAGYELLAKSDTANGTVTFTLRDALRRRWHVVTVGRRPRIYWLDAPPADPRVRKALLGAFNDAATYDDAIKYVHAVTPPSPAKPPSRTPS